MVSYWERRRREAQRRAFERSSGMRLPTGDTEASLAAGEARRVEAGRRAAAEARVAASGPRARAEEMLPSRGLFGSEGVGRDFRVEPRTAEEQERARDLAEFALFGPERRSVGGGEAGRVERFLRDWGLSEQEFRLAGERAGEGRLGAAAGWAGLGLAGAVPFLGDVAQGVGRAGRVASQAADVGRAVEPRITLRADQVERVQGMGNEHWFRVPDPDNPRGAMTLPGSSGGGRLGGRPMPIEEVPDEIYHVTTNAPGVRESGIVNVSRGENMGAGGTSGSGAVSTTASREVAENLQLDLRAFASLKNAKTLDDVLDILMNTSRAQGLSEDSVRLLRSRVSESVPAIVGRDGFDVQRDAKSIFNSWEFLRRRVGGPRPSTIIGEPFSDYWRSVDPQDIDIIPIDKSQIPDGALINDYDLGRGGLEEIQVYADIPLGQAANVGRASERIKEGATSVPGRWVRKDAAEVPTEWVEKFIEFDRASEPISNVDKLRNSIIEEGFKDPLILEVGLNGRAILIEGNHRLAIAKELGLENVPVRVITSRNLPTQVTGNKRKPVPVLIEDNIGDGWYLKPQEAIINVPNPVQDTPNLDRIGWEEIR